MSSITSPKPKQLSPDTINNQSSANVTSGTSGNVNQVAKAHAIAPTPRGGGITPYNTPADNPPLHSLHFSRPTHHGGLGNSGGNGNGNLIVPGQAGLAMGNLRGKPINAASAMRGRGVGITPVERHAVTPGNTLSSVERIGGRIAMLLGTQSPSGGTGRIAPSYERRFDAGLKDLDKKLHVENG
ncbi:hypothetical protein TREMEDRAFT_60481 [Tremella mesenterica DSM 1558]|uniref:uncharacterized protein n=1 Tax=Tremella mesenterica (strain ATCC 24925 / CBS 8224 / DSM 1558 / NBRC 9311 / NRRL Y-6157 / RJB 2259-6 / UBC 559-6) TaxID=578456 RepID=UPI0003F4A03C|nr:uncharacterized protein TREMEDRAFT_60481 [Tremella mesenterica DSM 1558]EIW71558.1 hypothetical protein TREMEDRAFT_60481 [Tremella mesenterica DSM 1558]